MIGMQVLGERDERVSIRSWRVRVKGWEDASDEECATLLADEINNAIHSVWADTLARAGAETGTNDWQTVSVVPSSVALPERWAYLVTVVVVVQRFSVG